MYNRKQRRAMEKALGLYKEYKNASFTKQAEIREKRRMAGTQIHLRNLQETEDRLDKARDEKYTGMLQELISNGMEEKAAEAMLVKNLERQEKREEELALRRDRQSLASQK